MRSIFAFDSMLTPKIITFVYWLMLLGAVVAGVGVMFSDYRGLTAGNFFLGLLTIAGAAVGARVWCELLIVMFKIHDNLRKLADKG
ncbi:DUF4282 domain-containing protein [Marinobacter sp. X15-166B]|uniref:DUF4282 domain-containing protein n=1 Tax=Marinobacter sp. X15-166B TaxID=1897620 RepID=UPI00085C5F8D|nr:DUF4282 domain-containing protein [Marinobacter sp. X15-166B]OEY65498.1 hypothetical protein BG841_02840 [Marinobacter sp. X15-166B]